MGVVKNFLDTVFINELYDQQMQFYREKQVAMLKQRKSYE